MGFAPALYSFEGNIDEEVGEALKQFLRERSISFVEAIQPENFASEFYEQGDLDDGSVLVAAPEMAWSSWSEVQKLLVSTLGKENVPTALHIHAWNGVAVPADIENSYLSDPIPREKPEEKVGFLQKLGFMKPKVDPVQAQMDAMVEAYGGPTDALTIVSCPRLVAEMEAAIEKLGIADRDFLKIYNEAEDLYTPELASVLLQVYHKIHKEALAHEHLVWWIK